MQVRITGILCAIIITASLSSLRPIHAQIAASDYYATWDDAEEVLEDGADGNEASFFEVWSDGVVAPIVFQQPTPPRREQPPRRGQPPRRDTRTAMEQRPARSSAFVSLASVPFMIGDTAGGTCGSIAFAGQQCVIIEHPTLACSRLNISENNSPLLSDRFYVSYRHFRNVTETRMFQADDGTFSFENDLDIDRFTVGMEKTFLDGLLSMELRIPIARELGSTVDFILDASNPSRDTLPLRDRDGEFGNISVVGKGLLCNRDRFLLSGGVALNLPTADDVVVNGDLDTGFIIIEDPLTPLVADTHIDFRVAVENETVNISPFLAWLWRPRERFFHQGFLQFDVAANPSDLFATGSGTIDTFTFIPPNFAIPREAIALDVEGTGKFVQQALMRLNLGVGYWLYQNPRAKYLNALAGMLEFHYTTTLEDAEVFTTRLITYTVDQNGAPTDLPVDLELGNGANRVDVMNLSMGLAADVGMTTITNGFVMPLSTGDNKAFEFEYNLQVQRRF